MSTSIKMRLHFADRKCHALRPLLLRPPGRQSPAIAAQHLQRAGNRVPRFRSSKTWVRTIGLQCLSHHEPDLTRTAIGQQPDLSGQVGRLAPQHVPDCPSTSGRIALQTRLGNVHRQARPVGRPVRRQRRSRSRRQRVRLRSRCTDCS